MNASTERQHYYHADASPVGGHITHPFENIITTEASSSLAQAGGHVSGVHESYRLDPVVSAQKAYSNITGAKNAKTGNWTTLTTSVVEKLNVLEVVTADRIVARLALEYPAVGYTPRVSFVGVQFNNLRVNGRAVHPKLNLHLLESEHGKFPEKPHMKDEKFIKKVAEHGRRITEAKDAPEWAKTRYGWIGKSEEHEKRGHVLCSLVEEIKIEEAQDTTTTTCGHVIVVPEFGSLFLGELSLDRGSFRLTMLRMELGCPAVGNLSFASAASNGHSMP
jgi:hypothetical protein